MEFFNIELDSSIASKREILRIQCRDRLDQYYDANTWVGRSWYGLKYFCASYQLSKYNKKHNIK